MAVRGVPLAPDVERHFPQPLRAVGLHIGGLLHFVVVEVLMHVLVQVAQVPLAKPLPYNHLVRARRQNIVAGAEGHRHRRRKHLHVMGVLGIMVKRRPELEVRDHVL
eukprot:CAMPEP_0206237478 /NCGR_PEP_ID=MMETSP0047_2-20121206/14291_1 /ASSEMBLY_ACC=CAM_ASM_000192 /TAXON_ID=195065 /ORGANISM="Chroomonas mesostigmatica_cf, Strain CCMP1168" /LENGTH=106 /DNA_ID=CAMNT_0053661925 /DNA_START=507 /DNA_END=823 /DNA_ORIENTATION=+